MNRIFAAMVMTGLLTGGLEGRESRLAVSRLDGKRDRSVTTNSNDTHRLVWEQSQHLCRFVDRGEDGWVELGADDKVFLTFRELRRNLDFIELYDQKRGYQLRLYKDALFMKGGNEGFHKFDEFTQYYGGQWAK
jgi:hypothetical protein